METLIEHEATILVVMTVLEQVVVEMTVLSFEKMVAGADLLGAVLSSEEMPPCWG